MKGIMIMSLGFILSEYYIHIPHRIIRLWSVSLQSAIQIADLMLGKIQYNIDFYRFPDLLPKLLVKFFNGLKIGVYLANYPIH